MSDTTASFHTLYPLVVGIALSITPPVLEMYSLWFTAKVLVRDPLKSNVTVLPRSVSTVTLPPDGAEVVRPTNSSEVEISSIPTVLFALKNTG